MSWLSSVFTAPGTNARQSQVDQSHQVATTAQNLLNSYAPYVQSQLAYQQSQQPNIQSSINGLYGATTQSGRNQQVGSYANQAQGQALQNGLSARYGFAGNPALGQAYALGAMNDANNATNQYAQQVNSPDAMSQALQSYLGAVNSQQPNYAPIEGLANTVNSQIAQPVGGGLASLLPSLLGLSGPLGTFIGNQGVSSAAMPVSAGASMNLPDYGQIAGGLLGAVR